MGTDGIKPKKFGKILDEEITIIKRKIKNKTYNISPYKEKLISKGRYSNPRMVSIPTNRDILAFSALTKFINASFKNKLISDSIHTKILDIRRSIKLNKYDSFIKVDIKNYYPSIDHDILFKKIKKQIDDEMALTLIEKAVTNYTLASGKKTKYIQANTKGIPQGPSFSNILSAIYFDDFDLKYSGDKEFLYYRFVDDILILCNQKDIEKIKTKIKEDADKLKLEFHDFKPDNNKSTSGVIKQDKFQFLGYKFFDNKISVRDASVEKIRDRIVELFLTYKNDKKKLYHEVNLKITGCIYDGKRYGWVSFFALIDDLTLLYSLDSFVKNLFDKYNIKYKPKKIKKFIKTYFELKKNSSNYIPSIEVSKSRHIKKILKDFNEDIKLY